MHITHMQELEDSAKYVWSAVWDHFSFLVSYVIDMDQNVAAC